MSKQIGVVPVADLDLAERSRGRCRLTPWCAILNCVSFASLGLELKILEANPQAVL